jgi:preprotein translocase subunit SecD
MKRNLIILIALSAGAGALFFKYDSFWGLVTTVLIVVWSAIGLLNVMDGAWRARLGFAVCAFLLAGTALWPTASSMSGGKIPCPTYVKDRITFGIAKGLDLQGGLRLVYTVEVEEAIRDKRDHFADEMRQELAVAYDFHKGEGLLRREEIGKLDEKVRIAYGTETSVIRVIFTDPADVSKIDERFAKKFTQELSQQKGKGPGEVVFKIRTDVETQIRERAVNQAKDTVIRRVDALALREASVTVRDEDIVVEVPGKDQKSFDSIKETIRQTARLEFKMVDDESDYFGKIKDKDLPENEGISIYQENAPGGVGKTVQSHFARMVKRENETMLQARDRFKKWVKSFPSCSDQPQNEACLPDDHQIGFEQVIDYDADEGKTTEVGWRSLYLFSRAEVTGDYITDATVAQDTQNGMGNFYVAITFSPAGADRFEEVTGANVQRRFAIILDDTINSAPVIKSKIGGGRASITLGGGDPEKQLKDAKNLETVLRSGALPAPITPSNESLIGPTLGEDAIQKGATGAVVGSLFVLVFMVIYYRKSGIVADAAVLFNLLLQMAILASLSGTMTLPGIAGLALTIGMAVDANVLINERIREELRAGRSIRAAVEAGYDKAFSSILDGHVTVFISGLILAQYGTGPVKGFAVTLIIGILASLYTGVFCTRIVFDWWARGAKVKRLSVGAEF